jgi:diacylglycerol kinase (ATP)
MRAFLRSFHYAGAGVAYVLRTQRNARVHLLALCLVAALGILVRISALEWAVLSVTVGLVFAAEMFNTVAEVAVDQLTQRYSPLAKVAKDVGAGGVLVAAVAAAGAGVAIFGPRLWRLLLER